METNIHENIGVVLSLPQNYHMVSHVIRCPNFSKKSATDVVEAVLLSPHQSRRSCVNFFWQNKFRNAVFWILISSSVYNILHTDTAGFHPTLTQTSSENDTVGMTSPWLFGSGSCSRMTKCITVVEPVVSCNASNSINNFFLHNWHPAKIKRL